MATWKKVIVSGSYAELAAVTASAGIQAVIPAGTSNNVLAVDGNNDFITDAIDPRVWGATLVDASGTPVNTEIGFWTDANTQSGSLDLTWDGSTLTTLALINNSTVSGSHVTGSFSGSFKGLHSGDGSGLTGLTSAAVATYNNAGNNRVITSVSADTINGEANLSFDGTTLTVTGSQTISGSNVTLIVSGQITGSSIQLTGTGTGTSNNVLVLDASNDVVTDGIDARVWGATLVDNAGGNAADTRVAYWSDGDSLQGSTNMTFDDTNLTIGTSIFGTNTYIGGNLTVLGDTFNQQVTNLLVEDRFILLNSGSTTGDGGIIVQTDAGFSGSAFGWEDAATRWAFQTQIRLGSGAPSFSASDAYVAAVVDIDAGHIDVSTHQLNGNIKVDSGDIYIYS